MSNQLQISGAAKIRSIQGPVVANSGVITALDGDASQYVRGDGTLADFPTSTGGGSSVSYYLNTSVSQGTIGGVAYKQLSKVPISGAGTDVTISANGYIASYITDANDPALLEVPAGNFNCEFYFSVNSNSHNPYVYAELYKYDGSTFTLLGSNQAIPEYLTNGTTLSAYYFAIPVATSVLTITDRIAIRIYVNVDGRTVTLHTENNHLCQVVTTFSKGLTTLNSLTRQVQFFQTGTSGSDFAISSSVATHTFNLPVASAANTGKLSSTDWSTFNGKVPYTGATANVDLGLFSLKANGILAYGNGTAGGIVSFTQTGTLAGVATGAASIGSVSAGKLNIYFGDAGLEAAILDNSLLTADRTYNLPDASGTLALTSNLSSYVPYTGATANVDLGLNNLTANNVFGETSLNVKVLPSGSVFSTGYSVLSSLAGKFTMAQEATVGNLKAFTFDFSAWASNSSYTYTLPAANGTIALTSNLSSYLPLAGGIMTGSILLNNNLAISGQLFGTSSYASMISMSPSNKVLIDNNSQGVIFGGTIGQGAYTYNFPSASGTLALLESTQTFTGTNTFSGSIIADGSVLLKNNVTSFLAGYVNLGGIVTGYGFSVGLPNGGSPLINQLIFNSAAAYNYTFPSATGTIALTSNLSAYLPLAGGTLTGALSGTSATFSSDLSVINTSNALLKVYSNTTSSPIADIELMRGTNTTWGADAYTDYRIRSSGGDLSIQSGESAVTSTRMTITSAGNVGIGTGSSVSAYGFFGVAGNVTISSLTGVVAGFSDAVNGTTRLYVQSGVNGINVDQAFAISTGGGVPVERMRITSGGNVNINGSGFSDVKFYVKGSDATSSNYAALFVNGSASNLFNIRNDGAVQVFGSLSKGSGSFRIEHPLESLSETHQLVHSFIEGPQADLIYRGKLNLVNGKAQANIDEVSTMTEGTFEALCREVQCFTTNESGWDLVKGKVIGNIIYIESQNSNSTNEISWMVIGERKDKHILDTDWTDDNGKVIVEPLKPIEPIEELNERLNKAGL
jgi:hypothetical protein